MIKLHKILLGMMIFIMSIFFVVKTFVLLGIWESSPLTRGTEYTCFLMFIPLFYSLNRNYVKNQKHKAEQTDKFLSTAAIISIADKHGKITYVNENLNKYQATS
jgi:hypothetical protein